MAKPDEWATETAHPARRKPVTNSRGEAMKAHILEVAKQHFGASGYNGVSTATIAADAGITNPGLLHHFQSKAGLLMAVLETRFGRDDEILAIDASLRGTELFERLEDLVEENEGNRLDVRLFSMLLAESVAEDHPSHDYFAVRYRHARDLLSRILTDAQERGLLKPGVDSEGLASALLALMDGLQYQWLIDDSVSMTRGFNAMMDLISTAIVEDAPRENR